MNTVNMPAVGRRAFIGGLSASLLTGAAPRRLTGTDADVIVIGAGLAGLHATALLENDSVRAQITPYCLKTDKKSPISNETGLFALDA